MAGYRVTEGDSPDGPFNRSAALNRAADASGDWDVAVIADADAFVPQPQLDRAVRIARDTGKLAAAFETVIELSRQCTMDLLDTGQLSWQTLQADRVRTDPLCTQSLILAVPRALWDRVGGFDEQFRGWSAEDNAFWHSCAITAGTPARVPGSVFHLWHEPAERSHSDPGYKANQQRWQQYRQARDERQLHRIRNA
jgi:hypothetical protein